MKTDKRKKNIKALVLASLGILTLILLAVRSLPANLLQGKIDIKLLNQNASSLIAVPNVDPKLLRDYPFDDHSPTETFKKNDITVIVPKGYSALAKKEIEDLEYCSKLVPDFIGMNTKYNGIIMKYYISNNDSFKNEMNSGVIVSRRSAEAAQRDLNQVINNDPEGFLYKSSPKYCANSHEFAHYVVDRHYYIPEANSHEDYVGYHDFPAQWANEGIAEYTQKFTQNGMKNDFSCKESGWEGVDYWETEQNKFFPYSDLSSGMNTDPSSIQYGAKWYHTAMCQWELFDATFGRNARKNIFTMMGGDTIKTCSSKKYEFLHNHNECTVAAMFESVGPENEELLKSHLAKFGFTFGTPNVDDYWNQKYLLEQPGISTIKPS